MASRWLPLRLAGIALVLITVASSARADIYVYRDPSGALHFSNAPAHSGFKVVVREWGQNGRGAVVAPGRIEEIIREASDRYRVDPDLVRAVIKVESDFRSGARSHKGAQGLMQLMPDTARLHNVADVYDPDENIDGGVRHLRLLLDRFQGDTRLALAAYNAGIKAVERHGGVPPFSETQEYIRRVMNHYQRYRGPGSITIREVSRR
jgi:soluble lytic murein transglycosylase